MTYAPQEKIQRKDIRRGADPLPIPQNVYDDAKIVTEGRCSTKTVTKAGHSSHIFGKLNVGSLDRDTTGPGGPVRLTGA